MLIHWLKRELKTIRQRANGRREVREKKIDKTINHPIAIENLLVYEDGTDI
jgi:hypothetical protein